MSAETRKRRGGHVAVLEFGADELRNIAHLLGPTDRGGAEMLAAADELDHLNRNDW